MRPTIAGKPLGARLSAIGCATVTVLASASVAACTSGTPSATPPSLSPGDRGARGSAGRAQSGHPHWLAHRHDHGYRHADPEHHLFGQ